MVYTKKFPRYDYIKQTTPNNASKPTKLQPFRLVFNPFPVKGVAALPVVPWGLLSDVALEPPPPPPIPLYIYPPIPVEDSKDATPVETGVPSIYMMTEDPELDAEAVT